MKALETAMTEQISQSLIARYERQMLEIKERTLSIGSVVNGGTGLHGPLAREFCYLQLRMICECIALSCLTAHGDMKPVRTQKLQKESRADFLMKVLEALHPDFYPHPVKFTITTNNTHVDEITDGYLTKPELVQLVRDCGKKLHRGYAEKYSFSPTQAELDNDFKHIMESANKILRLLEQHKVNLSSGTEFTFCILSYGPEANVHVFSGGPKKTN